MERDRRGAPGRGWQLFVVLAPWAGLLIALVNAVGFLLIWRDADVAVVLGVVGLGYSLSGLVLLLVALAHRRRLRADGRL